MKVVKYLGFGLLIIGAVLTIWLSISKDLSLEKYEIYANLMWPIGLIIYYLAEKKIKKNENETA